MSLNAQQKDALAFQLGELLEQNEAAAFFASLVLIVERQAFSAARNNRELGQQWQDIADALSSASEELAKRSRQAARDRMAKSQISNKLAS